MKQKVLGATLVLSAPVNSFASYNSKDGGKIDLSKLTDISAIFSIEIKKTDNEKTQLGNMKVKDGEDKGKDFKTVAADKFKNDFKYTLITEHKGDKCDKNCVKTFKFETEGEGKKLKTSEITGDDQKKIDAGNYVLVTVNADGSEVTVEKKNFTKKQKLDNNAYKDDDAK